MDPVALGIPRGTFVEQVVMATGMPRDAAERQADKWYGPSVVPPVAPATAPGRIIDPWEVGRLEHTIQDEGDKIAKKLGASVIKFSHPGKTKQTEGIADRIYAFDQHPDEAHRLAIWWEWKSEDGAQRPGQVDFERIMVACGELYYQGGLGDFKNWLVTRGYASGFEGENNLTPIPA